MYISISIWNLFIQFIQFIFLRKRSHRKANMIYYIEIISCKQVRAASRANTTCRQCHTPPVQPPFSVLSCSIFEKPDQQNFVNLSNENCRWRGGGEGHKVGLWRRGFSPTLLDRPVALPPLSPPLSLSSSRFSAFFARRLMMTLASLSKIFKARLQICVVFFLHGERFPNLFLLTF